MNDKYDIYVKQQYNSYNWEYKIVHKDKSVHDKFSSAASATWFKTKDAAIKAAKQQIDKWQQIEDNEKTWEKVNV